MGPFMFSQLYAMNPSVELALASSSVSVTLTGLMLAAASLLRGGAPGGSRHADQWAYSYSREACPG